MAQQLPGLQVLANHLDASHPGGAVAAGSSIGPRDAQNDPDPQLARLYAPVPRLEPDLPVVRANFITTLDGSVTGSDGKSGSINGPADLRVFQLLRAQSDAVFVGAGTARIEGYQDTDIAAGLQNLRDDSNPKMITITRSGELAPEFLETEPLVITAARQPAAQKLADQIPDENLLIYGADAVDLPGAMRGLKERGYENVLCEGGPHLMGSLIEKRLVSELCLSFSPMIVGGTGPRFMVGAFTDTRAKLQLLLSAPDGYLMSRWALNPERD